ncbi:hypothetical protein ACRALDRAFT_2066105, partial [Sodiomyces alcalophilus JCM 7366]|uniref:uncharacterized protein n=1 Tax=Sodiomyces alcalophilus JCM 7366 TaxID=591952 RepID=UPI0039B5FEBC
MVNVDFEWFNFDADIDFHGVKSLLRQLLDVDATQFDISALADLILSQNTIGSTVKVDGKETDAYAFLTALNLREHGQKPAIANLTRYLVEKARTNDALAPVVPPLLDGSNSGAQVGLVLSERLINMPTEIAPPMFRMLTGEIEDAVEDKEPYEFSHYLILSRIYREVEPEAELRTEERRGKKQKPDASAMWHFHPEDEVLAKHAVAHGAYSYSNENSGSAESKRAFQEMGIRSQGYLILIEAAKWKGAVDAVE